MRGPKPHRRGGRVGRIGAALMDELEREPEAQYALIRRLLDSIHRDIVPVFARHPDFYVSITIPPSVFGSGRIGAMLSDLDLDPWRTRLVVELTARQALTVDLVPSEQRGNALALTQVGHSASRVLGPAEEITVPVTVVALRDGRGDGEVTLAATPPLEIVGARHAARRDMTRERMR